MSLVVTCFVVYQVPGTSVGLGGVRDTLDRHKYRKKIKKNSPCS